VPVEAIPLALISSVYPFGLAALLLLLQAPRPKPRSLVFLMGAAVCTLALGLLVVFVLRGAQLQESSNQSARYGLRLAIGVLLLVAAWVVAHRAPRPKEESDQPSRLTRAVAGSGLLAVFFVGVAMYTPSPAYLTALQVVGEAKMANAATVGWVILVVALVLITIEVPILVYLFSPGWATRKLAGFKTWLDRNGRMMLIVVLAVLGTWEVIDGLVGLL
jgi:zinc transporter ZupT